MTTRAIVARQYHPILIALAKGDRALQRHILRYSSDKLIRLLAQIASNVLLGNIPLTQSQFRQVSRYKSILYKLRKPGTSIKHKRQLLVNQTGGFLSIILPLVASAIGGLVSSVLGK